MVDSMNAPRCFEVVRPEQGEVPPLRLLQVDHVEHARQYRGRDDLKSTELVEPVLGLHGGVVV